MPTKVACISLGCPKNLVDSEIMLGFLPLENFQITTNMQEAEIAIVNTCAFIEDAKEEAVDTILKTASYKDAGSLKVLIVTGCLAQRYREEIIREIPEVDAVIGTGSIPKIQKVIHEYLSGEIESRLFVDEPKEVSYLENPRILSSRGPSQYLKIAEGCSNYCTYCVIPFLRGPFRSRTVENILKEAKQLVEQGARELILIAQDVSRYGEDLYGKSKLVELIQKLSEVNNLMWIRLLYCYPERITDELILELKNNPKLLRYLDIPVQHASDRVLKAMGRKSREKDLIELMVKLRREIPDIILRTSIIAGFPGEAEEDYQILLDFVKNYPFDRLGVFAYSREEGTPAYAMKNQVNNELKQERRDTILQIQQEIAQSCMEKRINRVCEVLVEGVADDGIFYYGRSYGEAPEIDPPIYFTSTEPLTIGCFVQVRILTAHGMELIGSRLEECEV